MKTYYDNKGNRLQMSTTPTDPLYNEMKTVAEMRAVPESERLAIIKEAKGGSWYDDNYTPYCVHYVCKCTSPRSIKTDYGFVCPDCGNMSGWDMKRLKESPLNFIVRAEANPAPATTPAPKACNAR